MGNVWKKYVIDYSYQQLGNACGKTNEYSAEMDSISFYNYPKNGVANSCKIYVDNCILHGCTDPTASEDIDSAKWTALAAVYEPQSPGANAGAGCAQSVGYYERAGAWIESTQDMQVGDEIYYRSDAYVSSDNPHGVYHTGLIVDWGYYEGLGDGFKVHEGNTDGGIVAEHFVSYGDPKIAGAGRPNYDGWSPDGDDDNAAPEPTPTPEPEPEPHPEPTPSPEQPEKYIVSVGSYLNVRTGPGTEYEKVGELYNTAEVEIVETDGEWGRITGGLWVCMNYLYKV